MMDKEDAVPADGVTTPTYEEPTKDEPGRGQIWTKKMKLEKKHSSTTGTDEEQNEQVTA